MICFLSSAHHDIAYAKAFFIFTFKICLLHQSITPILSGAPAPKKNPGSAPESDIRTLNSWRVWLFNRGLTV